MGRHLLSNWQCSLCVRPAGDPPYRPGHWNNARLAPLFNETQRGALAIVTVRDPRPFARGTHVLEHVVTLSKDLIRAELATIEGQDPLFLGDLPVSDEAVRGIFVAAMATLRDSPEFRRASPQRRELSLLGILTHALLEAALLREQLRRGEQGAASAADRVIAKAAAT